MRKTFGNVLLVILIFIGSIFFTGFVNGRLGIFISCLLFVFFVSRFYTLIMSKYKSPVYKIVSGTFIAYTISLLFYILFTHANNDFNYSKFLIFFLNMGSVTILLVTAGFMLMSYTFVKKRIEKSNESE
ncbi:MAG: hypothetical protein KAT06_09540 [Gammaproteobacteria bacterium]|nr:hypothetical protein [Gammaproteobacteria bacterium]